MNPDNNSGKVCGGDCKCKHHVVVPVAIMLIGVTFLLQALNILVDAHTAAIVWPVLLIVIGCTKMCKCC